MEDLFYNFDVTAEDIRDFCEETYWEDEDFCRDFWLDENNDYRD